MNNYDLIRQLILSINKIDGNYYQAAKKMGINENTLSLLYALGDEQPHSQKQICEEWLIPKTTINTIVKELIQKNYLTLIHKEHSREKEIILTKDGALYASSILNTIYTCEEEAMRKTLQKYSPEFIEAFKFFTDSLEEELADKIVRKD